MRAGVVHALTAYALWGLIPIYFKALRGAPPLEVLLHRVLWSALLLLIILAFRRQFAWFARLREPSLLKSFVASAAALSVNWFVYIWAVNAGRVIDASLGYFVNPLVSMLLGVLLLHEKLRRVQWLAIAIAAAGVLWLTIVAGQLPWIALVLAASFGAYGFLRKTAALGALEGLTLETLLLLPLASVYFAWLLATQRSAFASGDAQLSVLLVLAGPITAVPLLLFAAGARQIPLSMLGFLQYIGPTLQLLLGVYLYGESFAGLKLAGYALIWLALALYSAEAFLSSRQRRAGA